MPLAQSTFNKRRRFQSKPLSLKNMIVSRRLWIAIGFILIVGASLLATILPIWEARAICIAIMKGLFTWSTPKRPGRVRQGQMI